jgi:hypothetical protein
MASIHRTIDIDVPAARAWDAMRDVGALHTRLVTGFVTDCRLEGDERTVTFGNGMSVRERIVDVSDKDRRVAWSAIGDSIVHHNASAQIFERGTGKCEVVWIADLLPHDLAPAISGMIEQGLQAMKRTLEKA